MQVNWVQISFLINILKGNYLASQKPSEHPHPLAGDGHGDMADCQRLRSVRARF